MKKRLSLIAIILSMVLIVSTLLGCNLVTTNNDRDYAQVVATVKATDNAPTEEITKRDVVFSYLNVGYYYIQYGYTQEQAITTIVEGLIENEILSQLAMEYYTDEGKSCTYNVADYLTEDEKIEADYYAYKSISDMIDNYEDSEEVETSQDSLTETVRTVPTNATNKEKELTINEKKAFVDDCKLTDFNINESADRTKAYNKVIKTLTNNSLLGDSYNSKIEETYYFNRMVENQEVSALLEKYDNDLTSKALLELIPDFNELSNQYVEKYNAQKDWSESDFNDALTNATASDPVLYGAYGNYGYVYNLLLGTNDIQKYEISQITTTNTAEKTEAIKNILAKTTVTDLRSTWIYSNYDFDGTKFTGDYAFLEDSIPFQGTVKKIKDADEEEGTSAKYTVESLKTFTLDDFLQQWVDGYVFSNYNQTNVENGTGYIYKKYSTTGVADYDAKINELLFAFSSDDGGLNKFKGYVISPNNAGGWDTSFDEAGKALIKNGGQGYAVVASTTNYGYYVMFFSQKFTVNTGYTSLVDYLENGLGLNTPEGGWEAYYLDMIENWADFEDTDSYIYLLTSGLASSKASTNVSNMKSEQKQKIRYNTNNVNVYEDRYADLLG